MNVSAEPRDLPWWRADRPWGFRFSLFDAFVVAAGVVSTVAAAAWREPVLAMLIPFTLGHFLLFCNIFRAGARRALLWIGGLIVNVIVWVTLTEIYLVPVVVSQLPLTLSLITHAVRSSDYHGIACQTINPVGYQHGATFEGDFTRAALARLGFPTRMINLLTGKHPRKADS